MCFLSVLWALLLRSRSALPELDLDAKLAACSLAFELACYPRRFLPSACYSAIQRYPKDRLLSMLSSACPTVW
ncbi:hypothetical protein GY45DRAFT_1325744 [Cubamyces sp. BRFM 1775]|nr:hypothetical protein GY45DRAFT_1325744 [Cubamyces sp. BRFM 1775]